VTFEEPREDDEPTVKESIQEGPAAKPSTTAKPSTSKEPGNGGLQSRNQQAQGLVESLEKASKPTRSEG
jgi:hypothetical protein